MRLSWGIVLGLFVFLLLVFSDTQVFAGNWDGHGPLLYRTQNPIYLEFLNPEAERALSINKGEISLLTYMQYSNIFEYAQGSVLKERLDM